MTIDTHDGYKVKLDDELMAKKKKPELFFNNSNPFYPAGPFKQPKAKEVIPQELINTFEGTSDTALKSACSFQVTYQDAVNAVNYNHHNKFKTLATSNMRNTKSFQLLTGQDKLIGYNVSDQSTIS